MRCAPGALLVRNEKQTYFQSQGHSLPPSLFLSRWYIGTLPLLSTTLLLSLSLFLSVSLSLFLSFSLSLFLSFLPSFFLPSFLSFFRSLSLSLSLALSLPPSLPKSLPPPPFLYDSIYKDADGQARALSVDSRNGSVSLCV